MEHSEQTLVYLLEDEDDEGQIRDALTSAGFEVSWASAFDQREWYSFLAQPASRRLAVVDLELGGGGATDAEAGATALLNSLWPSHRSLLTVIFSKNPFPPLLADRGSLLPNVVYVPKVFEDDSKRRLTTECLARLVEEVRNCERTLPCHFPRPRTTSGEEWSRFSKEATQAPSSNPELVQRALERSAFSAQVLDDLAWSCRDLGEVGAHASSMCVAVLGSVARGEARRSSDIEVIVLARREASGAERAAGPIEIWNRVRLLVQEHLKLKPELPRDLRDNTDGLLTSPMLQKAWSNQFVPVLYEEDIIDGTSDRDVQSGLRLRRLQLLLETRPVFNAGYLSSVRRRVLEVLSGGGLETIIDVGVLLSCGFWKELSDQFWMETRPVKLDDYKSLKALVLRSLNVLAWRTWCACRVGGEVELLEGDESYDELLRIFCLPAAFKLSESVELLRRLGSSDRAAMLVQGILREYLRVMEVLTRVEEAGIPNLSVARSGFRAALLGGVEVLENLRESRRWSATAKTHAWLFETAQIAQLAEEI